MTKPSDVVFRDPSAEQEAPAVGNAPASAAGQPGTPPTSEAAAPGVKTAGSGAAEQAPIPTEPSEAGRSLVELARTYLLGDPPERESISAYMRQWVDDHGEAESAEQAADAVEILALGWMDSDDPLGLAVAADLLRPRVAEVLVSRLGVEGDGTRRRTYQEIILRLPSKMSSAMASAAGEAEDRGVRRSLIDAITGLGEPGLNIARTMIEDLRWPVVRNGVVVLGEIGGENALAPLISTLAHYDPRVRRSAIQALAKQGVDAAGMLAVGMLEDPDPGVRSAAIMAVGALKVDRALKPLLQRLEAEEDETLQVDVLHALGRLGDPGAVPAIEKRAVGRFLKRSSRKVRIAAFQALAAIGTPKARQLIEQANHDRDSEVRFAVRALTQRP